MWELKADSRAAAIDDTVEADEAIRGEGRAKRVINIEDRARNAGRSRN